MKLIAHRGLYDGPPIAEETYFESKKYFHSSFKYDFEDTLCENNPRRIKLCIKRGFDIELDIRSINNQLFLGHDEPKYLVDFNLLNETAKHLWLHAKNVETLNFLLNLPWDELPNIFIHNRDEATLTSLNYIWTYPGKSLTPRSIAVLPELKGWTVPSYIAGVCSDYVAKYK